MDLLQEKIRKTKCPIIMDLTMKLEHIPPAFEAAQAPKDRHAHYCRELLTGLKGLVPGVRFSFDHWALMDGLELLSELMEQANSLGYFVVLDAPAMLTPWAAEAAARLLDEGSAFPCHALVADPYIGSDAIKPFLPYCKAGKAVFFVVRTPNRSAAELQDLMTGSRLSHVAAAEYVSRLGEGIFGKCGYSTMGVLTAATNANAVMGLRSKYKRQFLLVDGLDHPGGNGKNCACGFDRLGHGCAISVATAITAAWSAEGAEAGEYLSLARQAAERIRSNMARYVTIL